MPNVVRIPVAAGAFDPSDITITDNTSGAFLIKEGSNEYMRINTTDGTEQWKLNLPTASNNTITAQKVSATSQYLQLRGGTYMQVYMNQIGGIYETTIQGTTVKDVLVSPGFAGKKQIRANTGNVLIQEVDTDTNFTHTLDETSGAVFKIVDDAASPNTYLKAVEAGSVSTERNFEIYNSTAPATSVTDGCILFCEDVSSSSELKVRDEAGNVTTLSPHNFSLIPEGASEEMAWSYYSEKNGKKINVDMLRLARLVEQISGEQIIFEEG
jgi:hypothetical protein